MTMFYLGIECMENECNILVPEAFICNALSKPDFRDKYTTRSFTDHIEVCLNRLLYVYILDGICYILSRAVTVNIYSYQKLLKHNHEHIPVNTRQKMYKMFCVA